jgi:hypothetical protein
MTHTPSNVKRLLKSFGNLYSGWFPNSIISFCFVITLHLTLLSTKHQTTFFYIITSSVIYIKILLVSKMVLFLYIYVIL